MTSKLSDDKPDNQDPGSLLKVLTAHYHALLSARSDDTILRQYASLLRFLKAKPSGFLDDDDENQKEKRIAPPRSFPTFNEDDLREASLDDLEKTITDARTPRKDLEFIAVQRFSVPNGSMRTFVNRAMLVEKLLTLIGNERAHETIIAVAREQGKKP